MRTTGLVLLVLLSVGMGGYAAYTYGLRPIGVGVHPAMQAEYERQPVAVYTHIFGALVAMVVGPVQFSTRLRAKRLRLHRVLGRLYLGVGVLVGGFAGLYVSTFAFGGIVGRLDFGTLAVVWLYTGWRAYTSIRARDIAAHRRWMIRNFALTFSAVTFRLWLGGQVLAGVPFNTAYPIVTWSCWVLNLAVVELLLTRRHHSTNPPSTTSVAPVT